MTPTISTRALTAALAIALTAVVAADDATDLRAMTDKRFSANAVSDRAFYEALLAPNAVVSLPFRVPLTKQAYLDEEFNGRSPADRRAAAKIADFRAQVDGDTAVVTYSVIEPTPLGTQTFEARTNRLDTYVRSRGQWRLLSMVVAEAEVWPPVAKVDPAVLKTYAGTYELSPGIRVFVTLDKGRLMQSTPGQPAVELFAENETTFFDRTDSPLARTIFERDAAGAVVAQIYRAHGQQLRAARVPGR